MKHFVFSGLHGVHHVTHLIYFGLVALESHSLYGQVAGGLLIIGICVSVSEVPKIKAFFEDR